jgi:hypothetical protein
MTAETSLHQGARVAMVAHMGARCISGQDVSMEPASKGQQCLQIAASGAVQLPRGFKHPGPAKCCSGHGAIALGDKLQTRPPTAH